MIARRRLRSTQLLPRRRMITLRAALDDPALLGRVLEGKSWDAWKALLLATVGEPLTPKELAIFTRFTGRTVAPTRMLDAAAFVIGRRGGKDRATSVLATYLAALCDHRHVLASGERGVLLVIAPDQRQSGVQLSYIEGAFAASPVLSQLVTNRTNDTLELRNGVSIEVRAASFRRLRGMTAIGVIASEAAFWRSEESQNPDTEILNAVRPSLATTGGPLILISSPYARRGELWNLYRRHYGPEGDASILIARGASRDFNPTLPERVVQRALERDPAAAAAEFLAEFRADLEDYVSREVVMACVDPLVYERMPKPNVSYVAFTDAAGGSGGDSFTLAIGHRQGDLAIVDCIREVKPPFSPDTTIEGFAAVLRTYRVSKVRGDKFAGDFPKERFAAHGITYEAATKPKSDLYRDLLPVLNSGRARLLDSPRLISQLVGLERRTQRGGRDKIDHQPGHHDDLGNSVAGLIDMLATGSSYLEDLSWVSGPGDEARIAAIQRRSSAQDFLSHYGLTF